MKFNSTESFSYDNKKRKQMHAIKGKCLIRSQSTHKVMSAAEKKRKYFWNNTMFEETFLSMNSFSTMSKNGPQLIKYSCENSIAISNNTGIESEYTKWDNKPKVWEDKSPHVISETGVIVESRDKLWISSGV